MSNHQQKRDPIVLCHGLFGSISDSAMLVHFGERSVYAPDLLGYGEYRHSQVSALTLMDQAQHVLAYMDKQSIQQATLVGHSVGGAVATLLAINNPERVRSLVSVEGNMTPPDAFWSASLAKKSIAEIQKMVDGYRADVAGWIAEAGVTSTPEAIRIATHWLDHQPVETLRAQASAVVGATSESSGFLTRLRALLHNGLQLHLIAGARSRESWHVPADIEASAKTVTLLPDCGHLMILESPERFVEAVLNVID